MCAKPELLIYFTGYAAQYLGKVSGVANDSTVEILYQLGTKQDRWTADR